MFFCFSLSMFIFLKFTCYIFLLTLFISYSRCKSVSIMRAGQHLFDTEVQLWITSPSTVTVDWFCCCSVTQLCPTLWDPMTAAGQASLSLTISWSLPKFMSIASVCHQAVSSSDTLFFCPQSFPASGTFPMSWLFASDDQNTGISAIALWIFRVDFP